MSHEEVASYKNSNNYDELRHEFDKLQEAYLEFDVQDCEIEPMYVFRPRQERGKSK